MKNINKSTITFVFTRHKCLTELQNNILYTLCVYIFFITENILCFDWLIVFLLSKHLNSLFWNGCLGSYSIALNWTSFLNNVDALETGLLGNLVKKFFQPSKCSLLGRKLRNTYCTAVCTWNEMFCFGLTGSLSI